MTTDTKNTPPAGADTGAKPEAAAGGNGGNADAAPKTGDEGPKVYRPEGLAEHYLGTTDNETIDKLNTAIKGFRDQLAVKGPAKAEDYTLPEELSTKVVKPGEDGKDPLFSTFQSVFHKHNISQAAFEEIVSEVYKKATELVPATPEAQALDFDFKAMGGKDAVKPVQDGVAAWIGGLKKQGRLDDADAQELEVMSSYSSGLKAIMKLRELAGEKPIPVSLSPGGNGGSGVPTEKDLNARVADPRYRKGSKEFDQAFYDDTTKMFEQVYGSE